MAFSPSLYLAVYCWLAFPDFHLAGEYWWVFNYGVSSFMSLWSFADWEDVCRNGLGSRLCGDDFFNGTKCLLWSICVVVLMLNFLLILLLKWRCTSGKKWFIDGFIGNVWFNFDELESSMTHKKWWKLFFFCFDGSVNDLHREMELLSTISALKFFCLKLCCRAFVDRHGNMNRSFVQFVTYHSR